MIVCFTQKQHKDKGYSHRFTSEKCHSCNIPSLPFTLFDVKCRLRK